MKNVKTANSTKFRILIFVIAMSTLTGCSVTPPIDQAPPEDTLETSSFVDAEQRENALFEVFNQWRGVPYQLGGESKDGIDCSAFVQMAFRHAWQQTLPRTTSSQSKTGTQIKYRQAQYGDLVFFKTAPATRHVGVYIGNQRFMHASTSQGVMISRLDNPYWASVFWQFRRVQAMSAIH